MMDHKICFYGKIRKIIPKLALLPLLIWSTEIIPFTPFLSGALFWSSVRRAGISEKKIISWQHQCTNIFFFFFFPFYQRFIGVWSLCTVLIRHCSLWKALCISQLYQNASIEQMMAMKINCGPWKHERFLLGQGRSVCRRQLGVVGWCNGAG